MTSKSSAFDTDSPIRKNLQTLQESISGSSIEHLFLDSTTRVEDFSCSGAGLTLDYSKHFFTDEIRRQLLDLVKDSGLENAITAMFNGDAINNTEQRPALHVALRSPLCELDEQKMVHETLDKIAGFVKAVHNQEWQGYTGVGITDIVNIGIGGSDLGPSMVYEALSPYHIEGINTHFVSNVDPSHLSQTLSALSPESTLFIIASKSFTTLETHENAQAARRWFLDKTRNESALAKHFVAVSSNIEKAKAFGIDEANIFPMWDWVGGRYSLWSAIGLPIALGVGMNNFRALLTGAHNMDEHFRHSDFEHNLPVILALLTFWYQQFWGAESQAFLPYIQNLHLFPAFLQQLDMESLGKSVDKDGNELKYTSGGIVWGSAGTNGQHSFHQLLHQGKLLIPADFILAAKSHYDDNQHAHLNANCIAQSQAMMQGKKIEKALEELTQQGLSEEQAATLAPHKVISGNRPNSMILMESLSPETLGALVAMYEHKVFVLSVLLNINAFDQWGVELGKILSTRIHKSLTEESSSEILDPSTQAIIDYCKGKEKDS